MLYPSPLRYPGGKRKLCNFIKLVLLENQLKGVHYVEPYAGGAAVALSLLYDGFVETIHINDVDRSIWAFWKAAVYMTNDLCALIAECELSVEEWHRQREVQISDNASTIELGFSTLFLNRTNRSGIITGGIIGGQNQEGKWKLNARFNRKDLISRIETVGNHRSQIEVTGHDAQQLLEGEVRHLRRSTFVYLDPPYYDKGADLYQNHYGHDDHASIAATVARLKQPWVVSYDNVDAIAEMYANYPSVKYGLSYSVQNRYRGSEIMFFSDTLRIPEVDDPSRIRANEFKQLRLGYEMQA